MLFCKDFYHISILGFDGFGCVIESFFFDQFLLIIVKELVIGRVYISRASNEITGSLAGFSIFESSKKGVVVIDDVITFTMKVCYMVRKFIFWIVKIS